MRSTTKMRVYGRCLIGSLMLLLYLGLPACGDDTDGGGSDTDTGTDTDTDSDADTDSDSDTESDTDTGDGIYQWHTFYGRADSWDYGASIALDGAGNLVVVGHSGGPWNGPDNQEPINIVPYSENYTMYVLKLDTSGEYLWHTFHGSDFNTWGNALTIDSYGNPLVTGNSHDWDGPDGQPPLNPYSGSAFSEVYVAKLDSEGNYLWHTFYGGPESDNSNSVDVDSEGNIVIAGYSVISWNGPDGQSPLNQPPNMGNGNFHMGLLILKLNSAGEYQWHTFYGKDGSNEAYAVQANKDNELLVSGRSRVIWNGPNNELPLHTTGNDEDSSAFVLKLGPNGEYHWHTFYGDTNASAIAYSHIIDKHGDIFVTGISYETWNGPDGQLPLYEPSEGTSDIFVLKLDSEGEYQWHTFYGSPNQSGSMENDDKALVIEVEDDGDVFITGYSLAPWNGPSGQYPLNSHNGIETYDLFILKLDSDGNYKWHSFYGSPVNEDPFECPDIGHSLAVDNIGNVFIGGSSERPWDGPLGQEPLNPYHGWDDALIMKLTDIDN